MDDRIRCRLSDYGNEILLFDRASPLTRVTVPLPRAAMLIQNMSDREIVLAAVVLGVNKLLELAENKPALTIPIAGEAT